jgi:hypothetical protein
MGRICAIGTTSSFMMAEINEAWLLPEKAFLPVAIS